MRIHSFDCLDGLHFPAISAVNVKKIIKLMLFNSPPLCEWIRIKRSNHTEFCLHSSLIRIRFIRFFNFRLARFASVRCYGTYRKCDIMKKKQVAFFCSNEMWKIKASFSLEKKLSEKCQRYGTCWGCAICIIVK